MQSMKRVGLTLLGALILFLGLCGLYFRTAVNAVDGSRAALVTLEAAIQSAEAARTEAEAALETANEALTAAQAGTDQAAIDEAAAAVESAARAVKNAVKKETNKQAEYDAAVESAVPAGREIDTAFVRSCAMLAYLLLAGGAAGLLLGVRDPVVGGRGKPRGAAITAAVLGGLFTMVGVVYMTFGTGAGPDYGGNLWKLFQDAMQARRGLFLLAGVAVFAAGIYADPKRSADKTVCVIFLAPSVIAFLMTVIVPFFLGVYFSMTDWNGNTATQFVGFANFKGILSEPSFLHSFLVTIAFTLLNMAIVNVVAFVLALLVTGKIKGKNFYRSGFFVPNLIGGIVLGYIWQFIFNYVTPVMGQSLGIAKISQSMLANPDTAFAALVIVSVWQYAGYIMMIYIAAIQGLPESVIEAAKMDGAKKWKRTSRIVLPMIANAVTVCIFLTLVTSFKQFDLNYALTVGGPATLFMGKAINSTELLALNIYQTAFSQHEMAVSQAKAVIFFLVLVIVSLIQVWAGKRREVEM